MAAGSQGKTEGGTRWIGTRPVRPDGVDKVTGRARFGADVHLPNMLVGKVVRSPHAHARIRSIDVSGALALPGVKAVVTHDDFSDLPSEFVPAGEMLVNYRDIVRNVMAREKVLYEGHPVAAVAAVSEKVAKEALDLVEVDYEVLPHVLDVVEAMAPDAPLLHEDMITAGVEPAPSMPSNVAKVVEFGHGDVEAGFAEADLVVEREFRTQPVHQGYIEPHSCVASFSEDGQAELWCTTQGPFRGAGTLREAPRDGRVQAPGHCIRDRRRFRREDSRVPRAARADAVTQVRTPRQDDHVPGGSLPRIRPCAGHLYLGQGRCQEGRSHHCGRGGAEVSGRSVPGIAGAAGLHVCVRTL